MSIAIFAIAVLTPNAQAQRSRAKQVPEDRNTLIKFAMPVSDRQPILLKQFNTDSVAFVTEDELSDDMKIQQKKLAVREIGLKIYTKMTRKGFSLYSFEATPQRTRDNMRNAIVIDGRVHEIETRKKTLRVAVTIMIYAVDDPDTPLGEIDVTGTIKLVAERIFQSFVLSSGRE